MEWKTVEISKTRKGRGCFVSVRDGMIKFSAEASLLIPDYRDYGYAVLMTATEGNKKYVGVKLIKEPTDNSIAVLHTKYKGNTVNGFKINCKPVVKELFGDLVEQKKTVRYDVTKDQNDNILTIEVKKQQEN